MAGAAAADEGVVGLLLGRLPGLLPPPRLPDADLALSPFHAPGPSRFGSPRPAPRSAGQGDGVRVRMGAEAGLKVSVKGLSGGVPSSPIMGSWSMGSACSWFSISCSSRFFRYSGPMEKDETMLIMGLIPGSVTSIKVKKHKTRNKFQLRCCYFFDRRWEQNFRYCEINM